MINWDGFENEKEYWEYDDEEDEVDYLGEMFEQCGIFGGDRDQNHEKKKYRAFLYIRAHYKELMKDEDYQKAYHKIIDEYVREYAYAVEHRSIATVTESQREAEYGYLDQVIESKGKRKVNQWKEDAIYIVEWVKAGKSLIVYR